MTPPVGSARLNLNKAAILARMKNPGRTDPSGVFEPRSILAKRARLLGGPETR
jgi:hypothetical protein